MTATSAPFGLRPIRALKGGTIRPRALRGGIASAYGTSIYRGDPIKLVTAGVFNLAAAGDLISGVFAGWLPEDPGNWQKGQYWPASTTYTKSPLIWYWPADEFEFAIQANGSVAQTAIGDAADHVAGTGNTNSGLSGAYLAYNGLVGAGNSAGFKVTGLLETPDNAWGDNYTTVRVIINELNLGLTPGNAI